MVFGNFRNTGINTKNIKIYINGQKIVQVTTKYLGVIIDCNLNWHEQIVELVKNYQKAQQSCIRYIVYQSALITIYNSLFLPYLSYCCEVWGSTYETKLKCLFLKQKRAIRLINNDDHYNHTNGFFIECNIVKFSNWLKSKLRV